MKEEEDEEEDVVAVVLFEITLRQANGEEVVTVNDEVGVLLLVRGVVVIVRDNYDGMMVAGVVVMVYLTHDSLVVKETGIMVK